MRFGTWYQLNCETEDTWPADFGTIRQAGFEFVVFWDIVPVPGIGADLRLVVQNAERTRRAMDVAQAAGLETGVGVWNPSAMGNTPPALRVRSADGVVRNRPNIFDPRWLQQHWRPYVRSIAQAFKDHPSYCGAYFDDSFSTPGVGTYWTYTPADRRRFSGYLHTRFGHIENLNARLRSTHRHRQPPFRSFEAVRLPTDPAADAALWSYWNDARADWVEAFAAETRDAYRAIDPDPRHELVLSDFDFYMERTGLKWGTDYFRLMQHFDRLEIYQADDHTQMSRADLLKNAARNIRTGQRYAGNRPFQYHTWWTDPFDFHPMPMGTLAAVIEQAGQMRVDTMEIYTFKVHDWRITAEENPPLLNNRPPLKAVSMKYHPAMRRKLQEILKRMGK